MTLRILLLCVSAAASLLVCEAVYATERDLAKQGRALADQYCARCHAVAEKGDSPHPDAPPFRSFAAKWPLESLEEALAEGIVTGHPDMPPYQFDPPEIQALIEYMHELGKMADKQQ